MYAKRRLDVIPKPDSDIPPYRVLVYVKPRIKGRKNRRGAILSDFFVDFGTNKNHKRFIKHKNLLLF